MGRESEKLGEKRGREGGRERGREGEREGGREEGRKRENLKWRDSYIVFTQNVSCHVTIDDFHGGWLHFRRARVGVCV